MQKVVFKIIPLLLLFCAFSQRSMAQSEHQDLKERMENESIKQGDEAARIVDAIENYGTGLLFKFDKEKPRVQADLPAKGDGLKPLTYSEQQRWWLTLLKERKLNLKDTSVIYPKFIKFCVDVYNWGDRFFNTFDPEYVLGTGKRWKVRLVSDNWLDSYAMRLPSGTSTIMSSDVYANIGAYIQYMAVSVGTSFDIGKLFKKKEPSHKKFEFGFICALFNAELYYHENRGGTNIKKLGDFRAPKHENVHFSGVEMYTLGFDAYYFFNNKRYSQGAAYNFAKYQIKSQGSFLLGVSFTNQKLSFDFNKMPDNLKPLLDVGHLPTYYFHYNSYCILFGYGYNWVLAPKLLFNASLMPSVGISHFYDDSLEGDKLLASLNIAGRVSLTYNLGNYYFGLFGKMKGQWYKNGRHSLFSSIENFSAYVGLRF